MMAQKWNFKTHEYEPYELPEGATTFCFYLDSLCRCARCGMLIVFGSGYTSRQIHTSSGMGYTVCPDCYQNEWNEERANA